MPPCPKCSGNLQEQYMNGREILACTRCSYKKVTKTEESPSVPTRHPQQSQSTHLRETINFREMAKKSDKCEIVHEKLFENKNPTFSDKNPEELVENSILAEAIKYKIEKLYSYQKETYDKITAGKNVVITAPTASGKTEAFLFPILDQILSDPTPGKLSALFVYPTKALAADQRSNINEYAKRCKLRVLQLDGSTKSREYREQLVTNPPDMLVTNFDMISWHLSRKNDGFFSSEFVKMLSDVRFIVVDEAHSCTGLYGCNIQWILRRLLRINSKTQFIAASATLDNPKDFCSNLFPVEMELIEGNGKRGTIFFQILKPNTGYMDLMIDIVRQFGLKGYQVMAFNRSRRDAEMLAIRGSDKKLDIEVHRSGLLDTHRNIVEIGLRDGNIRAVSCTPTLELGINIGHMDGTVSYYAPLGKLKQRMGRAGRKGQDAFAYMVLDENNPISNYYINNPDKYFEDDKYHSINFENPLVDDNQILFMARDMPLSAQDADKHSDIVSRLLSDRKLQRDGDCIRCTILGWSQASRMGIRNMGNTIFLSAQGKSVGEIEMPFAFDCLYPGAIYIHGKKTYRSLGFSGAIHRSAKLNLEDTYNTTRPVKTKHYDVKEILQNRQEEKIKLEYCAVHITQCISKYKEKPRSGEPGDVKTHNIEPQYLNIDTQGVRLRFEDAGHNTAELSHEEARPLHTVGHLLIHAARMITGSESGELDGISDDEHSTILLYDNTMNGRNGASMAVFQNILYILERALEIIEQCGCNEPEGCPVCTHWVGCSQFNAGLSKEAAAKFLGQLVHR